MNEGDTLSYQLFVFCIYVIDRDREGNARTGQDFALKQKHRQIGAGAHCDGFAIGDLEVDLEAEMPSVPVSRFLPIVDWKPKAIETPVTLRKGTTQTHSPKSALAETPCVQPAGATACDPLGPDPSLPGTATYSSLRRAPAVADQQRVRTGLAAGGGGIRTLGPLVGDGIF